MRKPRSTFPRWRSLAAIVFLASAYVPFASFAESQSANPEDWVRMAIENACAAEDTDGLSLQTHLPGAWYLNSEQSPAGRPVERSEFIFALPDGHELRLVYTRVNGALRRFSADLFRAPENGNELLPVMQAQTDGACTVRSARRIVREDDENMRLEQLSADLDEVMWTETYQASWPAGRDPGGARVALVDSGLAYDLPFFRNRLARDSSGIPLGYDFWDLDDLPYDGDTARNVFQPVRHGTPVASIVAREAPNAALIPFRYPRPDMTRMADLVARADQSGARILSMPLGSRRETDWIAFKAAMQERPHMLAIVSAGNDGRNIDADLLWPAALPLENMIVVTSSDAFGHLADGSNWGASSVDLMVPAENQPVVDFRGSEGRASGTSYAVPRIAALAARLLEKNPDLSTADLKSAIFKRAADPRKPGLVAVGWILDPDRD
ncbi:MAG: S8 family serine peptidase [Pseudomonadota bacterium]